MRIISYRGAFFAHMMRSYTGMPFVVPFLPFVRIFGPQSCREKTDVRAWARVPVLLMYAQRLTLELEMKYLNGHLRNEHDSTMCMEAYTPKRTLTVEEYVPVVALILLLVSLLAAALS